MILAKENYVDTCSLTANSEDSGYPVDNLQDPQLVKIYRSTDVTGEWVKFDLSEARNIKGVFILNHNITSGGTVKIQANTSDSWTTPPVDQSMTYGEAIYKIFSSNQSYRWWRITIDDSSNGDGYIEIGRVSLSGLLEFGDAIKAEYPETIERTDRVNWSLTGQVFGDKGISQRVWTFSLPYILTAQKEYLVEVYNYYGKYEPLVFIPYEDEISTFGINYGVFNDNLSFNHIFKNVWNCSIALKEAF